MGVVKEVIRCVTLHVNGVPFLFQGMVLFCEVVSIGLDLGQSDREFVQCFPQWTSLRVRVSVYVIPRLLLNRITFFLSY